MKRWEIWKAGLAYWIEPALGRQEIPGMQRHVVSTATRAAATGALRLLTENER